MDPAIPYVVLCLLALYLPLLAHAGWRAVRRDPRAALLAMALFALAVAVRFLAAPRLPMVAATADMTLMRLPVTWALEGGFAWNGASQPPGYAVLLSLVFRLFGPSFDVAFATTTVLGAASVLPIFGLAARLGGRTVHGALAALAWATLPMAVIFANGVNLETPAAFLMAASFLHLQAWLDDDHPFDGFLYVLSMALLLHLRPEAPMQAVLMAVAQAALVQGSGGLRRRLSSPLVLGTLLAGLLVMVPYGVSVATWERGHFQEAIRIAIRNVSLGALAILGAAVAMPRILRWSRRDARVLRWLGIALAAVAAWRLVAIASTEGTGMLLPAFLERVSPRGAWDLGEFMRAYGPPHRIPIEDPRMFPPLLLLLGIAALLPARGGRTDAAACLAPAVLATTSLALQFVGLAGSGENIGDGVRHHVPSVTLAVVAVGLGAGRLLDRVPVAPRSWRRLATAAAVLACLSPLATHRAILADVDFNEQRRFTFLRQSLALVPPDAAVLLADHRVRSEGGELVAADRVLGISRTDQLFALLPRLEGRPRVAKGIREWLAADPALKGPFVFFQDLDCYRTDDGARHPACVLLSEVPGARVLARTRFANRPYGRYPMIEADEIELSLVRLPPDARAWMKARLAGQD